MAMYVAVTTQRNQTSDQRYDAASSPDVSWSAKPARNRSQTCAGPLRGLLFPVAARAKTLRPYRLSEDRLHLTARRETGPVRYRFHSPPSRASHWGRTALRARIRQRNTPLPIRVLPPAVAARIAAGEVIERPASIVKELVENALDAGATRIGVEIANGGIDLIRVNDDGCGIDPDELETAFYRHATSKLEGGEDLSRILTLGFRGEALPSVAAVGDVEVVSRPQKSEAAGRLTIGPDLEADRSTRGAAAGTTISVRDIFSRQPARRKFLRSAGSEGSAVASVVSHYALAYPEVRFSLKMDGRQGLSTTGSGDLRDAVAAVYGTEVAASMLPVNPGEGTIEVRGLTGPPHVSRSGRGYISLFVNRRWIQDRRLTYAVEQAYQGMLMVGRHPLSVLNIRLPHEEVDVNVHPAKAEVRFRDESAVFERFRRPSGGRCWTPPVPGAYVGVRRRHSFVERAALTALSTRCNWREGRLPSLLTRWSWSLSARLRSVTGAARDSSSAHLQCRRAGRDVPDRPAPRTSGCSRSLLAALEAGKSRGCWALAIELSPRHRSLLAEEEASLREYGFQTEPFGDGTCLILAVPGSLAAGDVREALVRFLDLMLEEAGGDQRDRVAMSLACHGAVRAGKTLSLEEMRDLVRQLEESEAPNTCPHGRPTMILMGADVLAREFGRR